jgi:predicted nucleotidyltransferase
MSFKPKDRKIIFEAVTGSQLFGTNSPKSDKDLMGVFLNSTDDYFGLNEKIPHLMDLSVKVSTGSKNNNEDVDRKFVSLPEFFRLALSGQSKETEALFVPDFLIITKTPEWELILKNRHLLLSKNSMTSFLSFARSQSVKATVKGDNLNDIQIRVEISCSLLARSGT